MLLTGASTSASPRGPNTCPTPSPRLGPAAPGSGPPPPFPAETRRRAAFLSRAHRHLHSRAAGRGGIPDDRELPHPRAHIPRRNHRPERQLVSVHRIAQPLAGPERRDARRRDLDGPSGSRIATGPRRAPTHFERPEPRHGHRLPGGKARSDCLQHRIHRSRSRRPAHPRLGGNGLHQFPLVQLRTPVPGCAPGAKRLI